MQSFPLEICIDSIVDQCTFKLIVIKLLKYSNLKIICIYILIQTIDEFFCGCITNPFYACIYQ